MRKEENKERKGVRPVVLTVLGHYTPGFRAGGILRSVQNMVDHLHQQFDFRIVTKDRDLGDEAPYARISKGTWQRVGAAHVYYLGPEERHRAHLERLVRDTPHDLLYLNSFFEPLCVRLLFSRWLGRLPARPVLLAPRGEFAWASLRQKYSKKLFFMTLARLANLHRGVIWHASSRFEEEEIVKVTKVPLGNIRVAIDLPALQAGVQVGAPAATKQLKIIFLSRISAEKNLDFALRVLQRAKVPVTFDIVGPIENTAYWEACKKLLPSLPLHVTARSLGAIRPSEVLPTLSAYDLLLFPSGGENYGHVIAEALSVGTRALISTNTPWRDLAALGLGWDLPLDSPSEFVRIIDQLGEEDSEVRARQRVLVKENFFKYMAASSAVEENRKLLTSAVAGLPTQRFRVQS